MGVTRPIEEYEKNVLSFLGWKYKGLKWCEFGNQGHYQGGSAKRVYEERGVQHTSFDLNGLDGALPIDLGQPMPIIYINQFDVVTNYGTIEHINNQFQAFKNIHDICRKGGIMIQLLPLVENWPNHGRYHYSENFVKKLAQLCNYRIVEYDIFSSLPRPLSKIIAVAYIKSKNNEFITKEDFYQIKEIIDSGEFESRMRTGIRRRKCL